jgi:ribonuclease E
MAKKMLIDATHPEETRVVVVDGNRVDDFDFESINKRQLAGNIYLAKITRVEPSLQAAFVDYGGNRHGFLAFSEIHPDYYQIPVADREALLAEEARAAAAEARTEARGEGRPESRAEDGDDAKSRSRRNKRRGRSKPEKTVRDGNGGVSGLEVIEPTGGEEANAAAEPVESSVRGLEITDLSDTADANAADQAEATADAPDQRATPKSLAESAGLDDEDSVSEDIIDIPSKKTDPADEAAAGSGHDSETGDDATPRRRSRRRKPRAGDAPPETKAEPKADPDTDTDAETEAAPIIEAVESAAPEDTQEEAARARARRRTHYKIQDVVKVRQIMLVQVVKEERGNKGAALTTYLSLAGRYCVLMPNTARGGGISRKITSAGDRKRLRDITGELDVPQGMGLIVRTAGAERTRAEIKRDYEFLIRQWEQIRELTLKSIAPTLIYEEGSLIKRTIRDIYSKDIDAILVEGEGGYREAKDYMKMLMPSHAKNVQQYAEQIPLFIRYQVESYLNAMFNPTVQLRSGGYIVIGVTEALVAIDVNSGRSTKEASIEETALKTNLEAADEVARQLRLRDLAGLIVIDFIDMEDNRNNRAVEKRMKDRLKTDRARIQVGRISGFGLMEMSRQRLRPGMLEATTQPCPHCHGQGTIRSDENLSLSILREVEEEGVRGRSAEVTVTAPVGIANYIMNAKRAHLSHIEQRYGVSVSIMGDPSLTSPDYNIGWSKSRTRPAGLPEPVITAESAAASVAEPAEAAPEEALEARAEDRTEDRGERSDGKSRRRRGRRGGQRRRREDGEDGAEDSVARTGDQTDGDGTEADTEAGAGDDGTPAGERRQRRRRGGRGRSRRQDGEGAETSGETPDGADQQAAAETAEASAELPVTEPETAGAEPVIEPARPAAPEPKAEPEAEPVAASAPEPMPEAEPEPVAAAPVSAPEPEKPAAPKRRGWWSRG